MVISDIRMPGSDGFKLLQRFQSERPELPIIIMTAHSDLDSAVAAYQGGAFEYLPKPFDVDEAVAHLKRHAVRQFGLRRKRLPKPAAVLAEKPGLG